MKIIYRSCLPDLFCKKGVLGNFAKFTGKHLCQRLYFNKVADSDTGAFLWILRSIQEHLFYRTPPVAASEYSRWYLEIV